MKLGAENRTKTIAAVALLALAVWSVVHLLTRSEPTSAATVASAPGPGLVAPAAERRFLAENENVFVAKEGDIVARRYRVLHISPNSVEVEDIPNNNRQTLPL